MTTRNDRDFHYVWDPHANDWRWQPLQTAESRRPLMRRHVNLLTACAVIFVALAVLWTAIGLFAIVGTLEAAHNACHSLGSC